LLREAVILRHARKVTFFMCGRAIERTPALAAEIVRRGHEPACHGWRWTPHAAYEDRASERTALERCIEITRRATGERPLAFFCRGSASLHTRALLTELGFEYDSNGFDDDLPYYDRSGAGAPLLVLPYALDSNDMKFFHPQRLRRAERIRALCRGSARNPGGRRPAGHAEAAQYRLASAHQRAVDLLRGGRADPRSARRLG
jgi:peptidoglycan/xylan/chitin deacetylase (PgdA/CDA1 family)